MLSAVSEPEKSQPQCKRCGTCCRNGGPALHTEDLPLLGNTAIPLVRLVTIRKKEPAFDQMTSAASTDRGEFVKINGSVGSWCCCFWNEAESSCRIYKTRPIECRLLFCEDTEALENVIGRDLLTREDIIGPDNTMMESIRKHDVACDYARVNELVSGFLAEGFSEEKLDEINFMVQEDLQIRNNFFLSQTALRAIELFLFGRPLFLVINPYGFRAVETYKGLKVEYVGNPVNDDIAKSG